MEANVKCDDIGQLGKAGKLLVTYRYRYSDIHNANEFDLKLSKTLTLHQNHYSSRVNPTI